MKKIPRDLSGKEFIKKLGLLGYIETRQVGSHVRFYTEKMGKHSLTIPPSQSIKNWYSFEYFERCCHSF